MESTANAINWFEISVSDMNRAKTFYETIFSTKQEDVQEMMGMQMSFFPIDNMSGKVGGGLVQSDMHKPSTEGAVLYLNANPDLDDVLSKVTEAGGKIAMPKMKISDEVGHMAFLIDSEGNKVGLHSNK
jgi:predicted enzyme related to lactoylglutathione lyase